MDVRPASEVSASCPLKRCATLRYMPDYIQVSTATNARDEALALAESAVRSRLAGSAQIVGPVACVFWHLGELGTAEEWKILLLTTADRYPALEQHLISNHPWDNPEITGVELVVGSTACLDWLRTSTAGPG